MPLEVCAHSMYCAIKAVADNVSNLSLREIHLVNIDTERTQYIQSVFLQLTSAGDHGSPLPENPSPEPVVTEPQVPSPDGDKLQLNDGVKKKDQEEVFELHSDCPRAPTPQTPPDGRNVPDLEIVEGFKHPTDAAEDPDISQGEKILHEDQAEEQGMADEQCHHSSSDVPDANENLIDTFSEEKKDLGNSECPLNQEDKKSDEIPAAIEALSTPDINSQTRDVKISDPEQKSLANCEPPVDHEDQKSTNEMPNTGSEKVLLATEESQTQNSSNVKDSETSEMTDSEEHHSLSSELEPQLKLSMQELNLEEYHESTPSSSTHEVFPQLPVNLPDDVSQRPKDAGPSSLESYAQGNIRSDHEHFHSLPVDAAYHTE